MKKLTYAVFCGPNSPFAQGSLLPSIEAIGDYIIKAITKIRNQNIKAMSVSLKVVKDFNVHTRVYMKRTVWADNCRSWFKGGTRDGPVTALHCGSRVHFLDMLADPRWEDYEYEYWNSINRFDYLGNGFSYKEIDGSDITWYLGSVKDVV